jgi:hypothetical protein
MVSKKRLTARLGRKEESKEGKKRLKGRQEKTHRQARKGTKAGKERNKGRQGKRKDSKAGKKRLKCRQG